MHKKHLVLPDTHQTWWQLTIIQLASWMNLPTLATSILVLEQNSFLGAALTVVVGNAILWFIRLGIVSMSFEKRQSTLDISRDYLGNFGSYFIAVLLLLSTLVWFITQTSVASKALTHLVVINEDPQIDQFAQMSVLLGIISAFLCMEGMVLLRRLSMFSFPFLVIAFFLILFTIPDRSPGVNDHPLSLAGLTLVLATNLGISSDLPTFFRHRESWVDSIKALTIVQLLSIALGIFSLYFGSLIMKGFEVNEGVALLSNNYLLRYSLVLFVFISVICANVANVYSASVGWEVLAPAALVGRKEYLILGLGLTIIFILISDLIPLDFLLHASDNSLVNLCIVLIIGYLIHKRLKKPPTQSLQICYFAAWACSSAVNVVEWPSISPLLLGFLTIIAVLSLYFLGERLFKVMVR